MLLEEFDINNKEDFSKIIENIQDELYNFARSKIRKDCDIKNSNKNL